MFHDNVHVSQTIEFGHIYFSNICTTFMMEKQTAYKFEMT